MPKGRSRGRSVPEGPQADEGSVHGTGSYGGDEATNFGRRVRSSGSRVYEIPGLVLRGTEEARRCRPTVVWSVSEYLVGHPCRRQNGETYGWFGPCFFHGCFVHP